MIESPRITVVLALAKLSACGVIGVEIVSSTILIFHFHLHSLLVEKLNRSTCGINL